MNLKIELMGRGEGLDKMDEYHKRSYIKIAFFYYSVAGFWLSVFNKSFVFFR